MAILVLAQSRALCIALVPRRGLRVAQAARSSGFTCEARRPAHRWQCAAGAATMSPSSEPGSARKRVVFLGTPDVAATSFSILFEASQAGRGGGFDIVAAVTQPPAPSGRKMRLTTSPVQDLAEAKGVPVLAPASARDDAFLTALSDLAPDLCITAAYGQFLPQRFLSTSAFGTLNVHPSLLPRWRGASPVQRCLEAGDVEVGVSIIFTALKMDSGPVVAQRRRRLAGDEKAPALLASLFAEGTEALIDVLPSVWDGSVRPEQQDEAQATTAAKITAAEAYCDLRRMSAAEAHNRARGFAGWPGTWTAFAIGADPTPKKVKLVTTAVAGAGVALSASATAALGGGGGGGGGGCPAGTVEVAGDAIAVACGGGGTLLIYEVQPPGKKPMAARAFVNGLRGEPLRWVDAAAEAALRGLQEELS